MASLKKFAGLYEIEFGDGVIGDYSSRMIKYTYDREYVKQCSGHVLYIISNGEIRSFDTRFVLLKYDGQYIKDFYGRCLYIIDGKYIRDFQSRMIIYEIDGFATQNDLMALFAIMFAK